MQHGAAKVGWILTDDTEIDVRHGQLSKFLIFATEVTIGSAQLQENSQ